MDTTLLALTVSLFLTNIMHAVILYVHRNDRKPTISQHASMSSNAFRIYWLGHFMGDIFFTYFAYSYFLQEIMSTPLFIVSVLGIVFDMLQASIPHRQKTATLHTIFAGAMAFCIAVLIIMLPQHIQFKGILWTAYLAVVVVLLSGGVYALLNKEKFYRIQMLYFSGFFVAMYISYINK